VTGCFFAQKSASIKISKKGSVFFKVRESQIRKFFGSFCYHKAANFLGVKVRKSQIHNFLCLNDPQIEKPANFPGVFKSANS
jgi:hypothetical protein